MDFPGLQLKNSKLSRDWNTTGFANDRKSFGIDFPVVGHGKEDSLKRISCLILPFVTGVYQG